MTIAAEIVFWVSFGALAWTHVLYPLAARVLAAHPDEARALERRCCCRPWRSSSPRTTRRR